MSLKSGVTLNKLDKNISKDAFGKIQLMLLVSWCRVFYGRFRYESVVVGMHRKIMKNLMGHTRSLEFSRKPVGEF